VDGLPAVFFLPPLTPLYSVVQVASQLLMPVWAIICMMGSYGDIDLDLLADFDIDPRFMCIYNYSYNYLDQRWCYSRFPKDYDYPRFDTLAPRFVYFFGLLDEAITDSWALLHFLGIRDVLLLSEWVGFLCWDLSISYFLFCLLYPWYGSGEFFAIIRHYLFSLEFGILHPATIFVNGLADSLLFWWPLTFSFLFLKCIVPFHFFSLFDPDFIFTGWQTQLEVYSSFFDYIAIAATTAHKFLLAQFWFKTLSSFNSAHDVKCFLIDFTYNRMEEYASEGALTLYNYLLYYTILPLFRSLKARSSSSPRTNKGTNKVSLVDFSDSLLLSLPVHFFGAPSPAPFLPTPITTNYTTNVLSSFSWGSLVPTTVQILGSDLPHSPTSQSFSHFSVETLTPEFGDFLRFSLAGSFAGGFNLTPSFSAGPLSLPSLSSFFLKLDALQDWRFLKLEREIWRTADMLTMARQSAFYRKKFYSNFYDPASLISKVSI